MEYKKFPEDEALRMLCAVLKVNLRAQGYEI